MRFTALRTALVVAGVIGLSGCSLITSDDCVSVGVFAIKVTVSDAQTNEIPAGTVVTITEGDYTETPVLRDGVFFGAVERVGTYTVTVDAPGYVQWSQEGVRVFRGGDCDYLQSAAISSVLQRAP